jgi:uncharacterized protein YjaZ
MIKNSTFYQSSSVLKFYLEIDNESPGKVGAYIGWQIVNSYMENNEVSLQQLLQMNAEIFENQNINLKSNVR